MEPIPDKEAMPTSSFRGRLNINNFKFTASGQVSHSSKHLATKIHTRFKQTKSAADFKVSPGHSKDKSSDSFPDTVGAAGPAPSPKCTTERELDITSSKISLPNTNKRKANVIPEPLDSDTMSPSATTTTSRRTRRRTLDPPTRRLSSEGSNAPRDIITNIIVSTSDSQDKSQRTVAVESPTRKKAKLKEKPGYAPPATFAHLGSNPLTDAMGPNLHILFCGLNPGIKTAETGHAYSSPTNRFWKIMHSSGVLPVPCTAYEDQTLPARFNLGLTNIVERPSRNGSQLSKAEMDAGVPVLEAKVRRWRPAVICLVGKSIWESVWRVHHGGKAVGKTFNQDFEYGWQHESENMGVGEANEDERIEGVVYDADWKGARVFVASSTSGLAATLKPAEKERIWRELGEWVETRRAGNKYCHKAAA